MRPALDEARAFLALPVVEPRNPEADRAHPPAAWGGAAAATLEARALAQGLAATVLTSEHGDFNDDPAALGPQALAARLGHGTMQGTFMEPPGPAGAGHEAATCESLRRERA